MSLLSKSANSIESLLSTNTSKRLKRLKYLAKVFSSHRQYQIQKERREELNEEYERLLRDAGDNWESEYEELFGKQDEDDDIPEDDALMTQKKDESGESETVQDTQNDAMQDDEDEWEDAEEQQEMSLEEDEHLDLLAMVPQEDEALNSTEKDASNATRATPKTLIKKRKRGAETTTTTTKASPAKKKRTITAPKTKRKTKDELKREIDTWKSSITILIARYRMILDEAFDDEMTALLLSLSEELPAATDSIKDIIKWTNKHRDTTIRTLRESLNVQCEEGEFLLLFMYALLQHLQIETQNRLVVRIDPAPYQSHQEELKKTKPKGMRLFGSPVTKNSKPAVIYLDGTEEEPEEPPKKKQKTNSGKGKATKKAKDNKKASSPYPVENLKLEFFIKDEDDDSTGKWQYTQLTSTGKISASLKDTKPVADKLEFPIFALGMYPTFTVDLSTAHLDIKPLKDTVTVQNNFNTITKWYRESQWCKKDFSDLEDEDLATQLKEEQAKLDKTFMATRTKLPKSQSAYRNHPVYVLEKFITRYQAIYPKDVEPAGHCGEIAVYKRENLVELHTKDKWMSEQMREVLPEEVEKPYKIIKSVSTSKKGMTHLYGEWQTQLYQAPTAKDGIVPKNDRGQVDMWRPEMLPKGCVHLGNRPYIALVCKKLDIDYAPCMVGFEMRRHKSVPKFDGVVVCEEFKDVLLDAYTEYMRLRAKRQEEKREKRIHENWSKLVRGLLAREKAKRMFAKNSEGTEEMDHEVEGEEI